MTPDLNIFHLIPNLDLYVWECVLDEADNMADERRKEIAIFLDPQAKPFRFRVGLAADRPIGWKVVHVSKPKQGRSYWPVIAVISVLLVLWWITQVVLNTP